MNNFYRRLIFGIFYVAAVLTAVLWHFYLFAILFGSFALISAYEFSQLLRTDAFHRLNAVAAGMFFLITGFHLYDLISAHWFLLLLLPLVIVLIRTVVSHKKPRDVVTTFIFTLIYPSLGFISLLLLMFHPFNDFHYSGSFVFALLIIVWTNDTFAYLTGTLIGKRKIFAVSPNKTWEGTISGVLFAAIAGFIISGFFEVLSSLQWVIFAVIGAIAAVGGDYFASALKRQAGVKDSGEFLPGHGGALDRFDSILFAAPFTLMLIYVFSLSKNL